MVIAIISIAAAVFLVLYVSKSQDCKFLERDNKWLKEQRERTPEPVVPVDDVDSHPLDVEAVMEAVRYNGFVPDPDGSMVCLMVRGERYEIETQRLPIVTVMKNYGLDPKSLEMDLMHQAAHQVSDEIIMAKVLFDEKEEVVSFQISTIENKFGHFKDSLSRYLDIIEDAQARMGRLYKEMEEVRKQEFSMLPPLGAGAPSEKKVMS